MTIRDIAKNLGVSYSTVSRCLNNDPKVSDKTKKRVIDEANRMGFTFNMNARSLVTKKSNRIGIIFSNNFNSEDFRWFFNEIETYSTTEIEKYGYDFIIQPNKNHAGISNINRLVKSNMVDGLAIFSRDITQQEYEFLNSCKIPHVYVYYKPPCENIVLDNFFWDDNEYGGYMATKHLIENGHKKILTIRSSDSMQKMYEDRTKGYLSAMAENDLEPHIIKTHMGFEETKEMFKDKFEYLLQFTAIFSQQDLPALSLIQEFNKKGIYVPKDISFVGYNNIKLIKYLQIPLDVMHDSRQKIIENAIKFLIYKIEGKEDIIARKMYPKLIVRNSVKNLNT